MASLALSQILVLSRDGDLLCPVGNLSIRYEYHLVFSSLFSGRFRPPDPPAVPLLSSLS